MSYAYSQLINIPALTNYDFSLAGIAREGDVVSATVYRDGYQLQGNAIPSTWYRFSFLTSFLHSIADNPTPASRIGSQGILSFRVPFLWLYDNAFRVTNDIGVAYNYRFNVNVDKSQDGLYYIRGLIGGTSVTNQTDREIFRTYWLPPGLATIRVSATAGASPSFTLKKRSYFADGSTYIDDTLINVTSFPLFASVTTRMSMYEMFLISTTSLTLLMIDIFYRFGG
jgi:hypothetical protein